MPRLTRRKPVRAATLADVGREAGVSAMAASAVLNGARTSSRISQETRERILEAATKLRYRPNAAARALADRRMNTLGVAAVFDDTGELNSYFLEIFNGVIGAAAHHGQNTTVFTLHDWEKDADRLPSFCDGRIDGLILIAPVLSRASTRLLPDHTPFVALHANTHLPGTVNLETDEERGAFEMVKHLIDRGHRRIVHITGERGLLGSERRILGYERALATARIPFDKSLLVEAGFSAPAGRRAIHEWLDRCKGQPLPDAIFGANDAIAVGCIEAFSELGIRVPEDISVCGFDDTLVARLSLPQLTTVRQPLRAMGVRAVELLLNRISHQHGDAPAFSSEDVIFPTELVLRNSVANCPSSHPVVPGRKR